MKGLSKLLLLCIAVNLTSYTIYAFEPESIITDSGIKITPLLAMGIKSDDNILSRPTNEIDSSIFTIAPTVSFLQDDGINAYELDLGLEKGYFDGSSEDNYLDAYLSFTAHVEAGILSRWDLAANVTRETEARGTGITENDPEQFDKALEYDTKALHLAYEYGALTTQMRVGVELGYTDKQYIDFEQITAPRNYETWLAGGTFYYSTNSKTDMYFQLTEKSTRYQRNEPGNPSRNSDDVRALLGINWQASAFLTADFKVGQQEKDFLSSGREDFSGLSWALAIDWKPLTYSKVTVASSRAAKDPFLQGDFINETAFEVSWEHKWNIDFSTNVNFLVNDEEYGGFATNRSDDSRILNLELSYTLTRWLDVEVFFSYIDKNSSRADLTFDKTIVGFNFLMSI